ncbi:helix-turn-helix transcriptional regulator [Mameliella sediminis]|uniref:helix-turn-helix transcriptional regulator n=1 Tax=Mameliella sediminis TaxID=2836866 RepID=UPI001CD6707C|nr:LuxR C-terminal-related transcriptional regulator [Mameliella alba]
MKTRFGIGALFSFQLCCAGFFLSDILSTRLGMRSVPIPWALYELIQIGAAIGLIVGLAVTATLLGRSLRARARAEDSLRLARGAFMDVLDERFAEWSLTPAERDVALMAIKGLSTAEIAAVRKTSEGTVKAQTNAIYRKAQVTGRPQLLSLFIDDLIAGEAQGDLLPENT